MTDMLIAQQVLKFLQGKTVSFSDIRDLIALMCVSEVKEGVVSAFKFIKEWVVDFLKWLCECVSAIKYQMKSMRSAGAWFCRPQKAVMDDRVLAVAADATPAPMDFPVVTMQYPASCLKLLAAIDNAVQAQQAVFTGGQQWQVKDREHASYTETVSAITLTSLDDRLHVAITDPLTLEFEVRGARARVSSIVSTSPSSDGTSAPRAVSAITLAQRMVSLPKRTSEALQWTSAPVPFTPLQLRMLQKLYSAAYNSSVPTMLPARFQLLPDGDFLGVFPGFSSEVRFVLEIITTIRCAVGPDGCLVAPDPGVTDVMEAIRRAGVSSSVLSYGALFGWSYERAHYTLKMYEQSELRAVCAMVNWVRGVLTPSEMQNLCLMISHAKFGQVYRDGVNSSSSTGGPGSSTVTLQVRVREVCEVRHGSEETGHGSALIRPTVQDTQVAFRKWIVEQGRHVLDVSSKQPVYMLTCKRTCKTVSEPNPEYTAWEQSMRATTKCLGSLGTAAAGGLAGCPPLESSAGSSSVGSSGSSVGSSRSSVGSSSVGSSGSSGSVSGSGSPGSVSPESVGNGGVGVGSAACSAAVTTAVLEAVGCAPPAVLTRTIHESEVCVKQINEFNKPFDTLYLEEDVRDLIWENVRAFRDYDDRQAAMGFARRLNILLVGPPGTGKTSTIAAIATSLSMPIWYANLAGVTCGELANMFRTVYQERAGGVVVLEDIDRMTPIVLSDGHEESKQLLGSGVVVAPAGAPPPAPPTVVDLLAEGTNDAPLNLSYFLNFLDGVLLFPNSVVIATTNHPEKLDAAFKRPGRFDLTVVLDHAKHDQIRQICRRMLGRDVDPAVLARIPEGKFSTADIIFHCKGFVHRPTVPDTVVFERFCE